MSESRENQHFPIEQVLRGKTIAGLPEGAEPLESFVLIKVKYEDGPTGWSFRMDDDYNPEALLGCTRLPDRLAPASHAQRPGQMRSTLGIDIARLDLLGSGAPYPRTLC